MRKCQSNKLLLICIQNRQIYVHSIKKTHTNPDGLEFKKTAQIEPITRTHIAYTIIAYKWGMLHGFQH